MSIAIRDKIMADWYRLPLSHIDTWWLVGCADQSRAAIGLNTCAIKRAIIIWSVRVMACSIFGLRPKCE